MSWRKVRRTWIDGTVSGYMKPSTTGVWRASGEGKERERCGRGGEKGEGCEDEGREERGEMRGERGKGWDERRGGRGSCVS